jgi:hypothetical protein
MSRRPAPLTELSDTLILTRGRAAAVQSGLLAAELVAAPGWLRSFGEGYFQYLGRLPLLATRRTADGAHSLGLWPAPTRLALLRFASPYLAARRGGRELCYPIVGGLMARGAGGQIAFGLAPAGARARVWIEVREFWPRLGLGPLYILTQVVLHRLITVAYLRKIAAGAPMAWPG